MSNFIIDRDYHFKGSIAKEVGVNGAIMLNHLQYWIMHNKAHEANFHDGEYWTYSTRKALCEIFPFWSEKQIRTILEKLVAEGYLKTGNYNKISYDRTLWYTLTEKGWRLFSVMQMPEWLSSNCPNGQMEETEEANRTDQNGTPIPDNITYNKTNNNKASKRKETRHKYGEYQHVLLSDAEYNNLVNTYGEDIIKQYITKMDDWIEAKGKSPYKRYGVAIKNWLKKAGIEPNKNTAKKEEQEAKDEEYFTKLMMEQLNPENKL